MNLMTRVYNKIVRHGFQFNERFLRLHVLPIHFYTPVPDTRKIQDTDFDKIFSCKGIDWNESVQLRNLQNSFTDYQNENIPDKNTGLSLVDAQILYSFIRESKPRLMIEIGGGDTTLMSLSALKKNKSEGHDFKFISIEPYPRDSIRSLSDANFELIPKNVQEVDISVFKDVDLLFIDSSHVCKFGSDVNYELLEIVPSLKKGALIHWHDILFPSDYWKEWILKNNGMSFWNESYFLQAFMSYNDSFKVEWASRYMQLNHEEKIKNCFPYYASHHHVMSFWARRIK